MPVSYSFDGNILRMDFVGTYSPDAIFEALERALADPYYPSQKPDFLLDVTRSESLIDRSADDLRMVVEHVARKTDLFGRRCAMVAETAVHYGLMRMAAAFAEMCDARARVFKTREEALRWLNQEMRVAD
jgi:hypothetical protein